MCKCGSISRILLSLYLLPLQAATSCCRAASPLLHQPGTLWPRWVPCCCCFVVQHLHEAAVHLNLTMLSGAVLTSSHPAPFCALRHSVMPAAVLVGAQDLFSTVSLHLCRLGEAALWLMLH